MILGWAAVALLRITIVEADWLSATQARRWTGSKLM